MKITRKYFMMTLLMLGILYMVFPTDTIATETRMGSMGGVGFYTRDNSNIFVFPGTFLSYPNQVVAEMRDKNNDELYSIGVHMPIGSNGVFGVYLNRPLSFNIPFGVANNVQLDRATDLFYGTKLAGYDLGLNLTIGLDKYNTDIDSTTEQTESARYFALSAGLSNDKMDLGISFNMPSASFELDSLKNDWSGFGVGLNARYFLKQNDALEICPLAVVYYSSTSREIDPGGGADKAVTDYNQLNLAAGIGINYELNENNLLVIGIEGIGLSTTTTEVKEGPETTNSIMTLPGIYVGVESKINDWLIGRMGAAQVFQSITTTTKPYNEKETETTSYMTQFNMTFGLGITFGSFVLDASINEGLLFDGPNFISGSDEKIANRLSITYNF